MHQVHPPLINLLEKIIIAWALFAITAYFVQKATFNYTFDYKFIFHSAYEDRFEGVLKALPAIGKAYYVSDFTMTPSSKTAQKYERLAKYFLAPYLSDNPDLPYYITNFHNEIDLQQWAQARQLILVKDFHNGVALFKKKDPA